MDDSIVEFPHAMAGRLVKSGRAIKFPFLASSMRLKQNLTTVRELGSAVTFFIFLLSTTEQPWLLICSCRADLRLEWSSYTSLLQVHPKKCRRSMRISKKEFCSRLYPMGHFGQSSYLGESDEGNDAPDDPGDGPLRPRADAGAVVAQFAARCDEVRQADRQEYLLMREWLSACLEPSLFGSMPVLDDGHKKALFEQVLAVNPTVKTVEMLKEAGNEDNPNSFKIAVQADDRWAPVNFDPGALGDHAEVFTMSEPTDVDSIKDLAATPGDRATYFHWLAEESDVELYTHLWQPRHLAPPRSWTLGHRRLLTLCLLDALAGMGFVGEACVIEHDPETPRLVFDNRKPMSKKAYFRCVIAAAGLLAAGVTSFKSNRSTAFCAYLLRHSKPPPHAVTTKQLQTLVKGTNSEEQPVVQEALKESVPLCGSLEEIYVSPVC